MPPGIYPLYSVTYTKKGELPISRAVVVDIVRSLTFCSRESIVEGLRIAAIKRNEPVTIFVNGKETLAYKGETVFAALQATGYRILNKSKAIGEARGGLCGMGVCYGCLVSINGLENQRSCMVEVEANMEITIDEI